MSSFVSSPHRKDRQWADRHLASIVDSFFLALMQLEEKLPYNHVAQEARFAAQQQIALFLRVVDETPVKDKDAVIAHAFACAKKHLWQRANRCASIYERRDLTHKAEKLQEAIPYVLDVLNLYSPSKPPHSANVSALPHLQRGRRAVA